MYKQALLLRNILDEGTSHHWVDWVAAIYIAVGLVAVRLLSEAYILPAIKRALQQYKDGLEKSAYPVFDNAWIVLFAGGLTVYAWVVVVLYNGGCSQWNVEPCLLGWPDHPATKQLRWFFLLMFGYYLYEMLCTVIGKGTVLGTDMVIHHVITMMLMATAHEANLMRYGLMSMAQMDLSNPILHSAKICDKLGLPETEKPKWILFSLFTLTFFVARVVLMPWCLLRPCFTLGFTVLPYSSALFCTVLMHCIYALQLFWFYKIVKLATRKS